MSGKIRVSLDCDFYFLDNDNEHTCATDFNNPADICPFYRTASFGQKELCGFAESRLLRKQDGTGFLIPCKGCIFNKYKWVRKN